MESAPKLLRKVKLAYDRICRDHELICRQGFYAGCHVLKLQKSAWTNDDMRRAANETGIFFSIWVSKDSLRQRRAHYNIHALKLRQLAGYRLTSREFAADFRRRFARFERSWPNVSVKHGPQTLMQGWIEIVEEKVEGDVLGLMERFEALGAIIDEMLVERRARG